MTKQINISKARKQEDKKKFRTKFIESIKYLPREQMKGFIDKVKLTDDKNRQRNYLMFRMLLSSGCRIAEFSKIQINDIDFEQGLVIIYSENTKTKSARFVRLNKELLLDIKDYIQTNNIKNGYLFYNKITKHSLTPRYYNKLIEKYSYGLNLKYKLHAHMFRHSHIVYALQDGVNINAVMKQVGHSRLTTTQIYSNIAGTQIKEAYSKVDF